MYPNNDYIYDAGVTLEQLSSLAVTIESRRNEYDGIITISGHTFIIEAKSELRKENKGFLIARLDELKTSTKRPTLVIAKYITTEVALELKENYNCKNEMFEKIKRNVRKTHKRLPQMGSLLYVHYAANLCSIISTYFAFGVSRTFTS